MTYIDVGEQTKRRRAMEGGGFGDQFVAGLTEGYDTAEKNAAAMEAEKRKAAFGLRADVVKEGVKGGTLKMLPSGSTGDPDTLDIFGDKYQPQAKPIDPYKETTRKYQEANTNMLIDKMNNPGKYKNPQGTPAETAIDKKYGSDYADWVLNGGSAASSRGIAELKRAKGILSKSDSITGPLVGTIPKKLRDVINPTASAVQESVEGVVQNNLKQILGAQYTEKEGANVLARAYNPKLSEKENSRRIELLSKQLEAAAQAKNEAAAYYDQNGTIKGYKGKIWTANDFLSDNDLKNPEHEAAKMWLQQNPNSPDADGVRKRLEDEGAL